MTPEVCPNCGELVPPKARACPHCGSCEETGWSEQAAADSLGLPDENFDYDEFVKRELSGKSEKPRGLAPFWWVVAIVVLITLILMLVRY